MPYPSINRYDAGGHTVGYGSNSFTYNDRGRIAVANGTDYLYNALGQMIEKSGTAGTTVLMQDESGHLIGEYNGSGQVVEETIWLGDIPVATLQPNGSGGVNVYYVHTDHLNSPRKIAQPTTGTLAWRWDTDPFGTAAPNQNPAGLGTFSYNMRFPGQYYQAETGLNYNWNRDYDPMVARYVESDPIGLKAGINTYSYVRQQPTMLSDPTGLDPPFTCFPGWRLVETSPGLYGCLEDPNYSGPNYCPSGDCAFYPPETNCSFTQDCYKKVMEGSFWGEVSFKVCEKLAGKSGIPFAGSILCKSAVWAACGTATHSLCAGCGNCSK